MFASIDRPAAAPEPAPPAVLGASVIAAFAAREAAQTDLLLVLGEVIATHTFTLDGSTTAAEWLRRRVDIDEMEARGLVAAATRLQAAPLVTAAVRGGGLSARAAELLTRPLGIERLQDTFADQEQELLSAVEGRPCDEVGRFARQWAARWEPVVAAAEDGRVSQARVRKDRLGRTIVNGVFELVDGEPMEVELRGVMEQLRHNQHDQPEGERLTGDALLAAAMAEIFARSSGNTKHNPAAPTVVINVPEDQLDAFLAQHPDIVFNDDPRTSRDHTHADADDEAAEGGHGPSGECGCPAPPRPALLNGEPITSNQLRRFLCDSLLAAVVVASDGAILRLGRRERTATPTQRLYLALRDGGCTFPGCSAPAYRCRVHHIVWWCRGGRTDIDELCLVCDQHHKAIHDHRWTLTQTPDGHDWTSTATGQTRFRPHAKHWGAASSPPT